MPRKTCRESRQRRQTDLLHSHKAQLEKLEDRWAIGSLLYSLPGGLSSGLLAANELTESVSDVAILPDDLPGGIESTDQDLWNSLGESLFLDDEATDEWDVLPLPDNASVATVEADDPLTIGDGLSTGTISNSLFDANPFDIWDAYPQPEASPEVQFAIRGVRFGLRGSARPAMTIHRS